MDIDIASAAPEQRVAIDEMQNLGIRGNDGTPGSRRGGASPRWCFQASFAAAQQGQPPRALALYKSGQSFTHQAGFFLQPGQRRGFGDKLIIERSCRPHISLPQWHDIITIRCRFLCRTHELGLVRVAGLEPARAFGPANFEFAVVTISPHPPRTPPIKSPPATGNQAPSPRPHHARVIGKTVIET